MDCALFGDILILRSGYLYANPQEEIVSCGMNSKPNPETQSTYCALSLCCLFVWCVVCCVKIVFWQFLPVFCLIFIVILSLSSRSLFQVIIILKRKPKREKKKDKVWDSCGKS